MQLPESLPAKVQLNLVKPGALNRYIPSNHKETNARPTWHPTMESCRWIPACEEPWGISHGQFACCRKIHGGSK
jgi:hypothetical protein